MKRNKRKLNQTDMMMVGLVMQMHFGPCDNDRVETCNDCEDFKVKCCPGKNLVGVECWRCMEQKVMSGEIQFGGSF